MGSTASLPRMGARESEERDAHHEFCNYRVCEANVVGGFMDSFEIRDEDDLAGQKEGRMRRVTMLDLEEGRNE